MQLRREQMFQKVKSTVSSCWARVQRSTNQLRVAFSRIFFVAPLLNFLVGGVEGCTMQPGLTKSRGEHYETRPGARGRWRNTPPPTRNLMFKSAIYLVSFRCTKVRRLDVQIGHLVSFRCMIVRFRCTIVRRRDGATEFAAYFLIFHPIQWKHNSAIKLPSI